MLLPKWYYIKYEILYSPLKKAKSIKTQREYALPFPIVFPYLFSSPSLSLSTRNRYLPQSDRHGRQTGTLSASSIQQKGGTISRRRYIPREWRYGVFRMRGNMHPWPQDEDMHRIEWIARRMGGYFYFSLFLSFFSASYFRSLLSHALTR